jgi:hypothetical protein
MGSDIPLLLPCSPGRELTTKVADLAKLRKEEIGKDLP